MDHWDTVDHRYTMDDWDGSDNMVSMVYGQTALGYGGLGRKRDVDLVSHVQRDGGCAGQDGEQDLRM